MIVSVIWFLLGFGLVFWTVLGAKRALQVAPWFDFLPNKTVAFILLKAGPFVWLVVLVAGISVLAERCLDLLHGLLYFIQKKADALRGFIVSFIVRGK